MPKHNQTAHNGKESCVCFVILYCIPNNF